MLKVQVYLTVAEHTGLNQLSQQMQIPEGELIRKAIDLFLKKKLKTCTKPLASIENAAGMWANRTDLPNCSEVRGELDKGSPLF